MNYLVIQNLDTAAAAPTGGLILWGGVSAPEGWSFDTDFDDCFVMGGTALDTLLKGAVSHTHTLPDAVAGGAHKDHSVSVAASTQPSSTGAAQSAYTTGRSVGQTHTHGGTGSGVGNSVTHTHTAPATEPVEHLPYYTRMRWITGGETIPVGGVVMRNAASGLPSGWAICNGQNGTPDMRGRFVYGGTGVNGGNPVHYHKPSGKTSENGAHTHSGIAITSDNANAANNANYVGGDYYADDTHNHTASNLTSTSGGAHDHSINQTGEKDAPPPYVMVYYAMRME